MVPPIRAHVRSADRALTKVVALVDANHDAAAAIQTVRNRRQTQAATREAGRLRGRAKATAMRLVARQRNDNAETYAELVDEVGGSVQVDIARAIGDNLNGREKALSVLTGLVSSLPTQAQPGIARAITAISADGQDEVLSIATAMQSGRVSDAAQVHLDTALALATSAMGSGLERLQGMVSRLPSVAQGPVQNAIDRVTGILHGLFGGGTSAETTAGGMLSNLPIPGGLPIPGFLPFAGGR